MLAIEIGIAQEPGILTWMFTQPRELKSATSMISASSAVLDVSSRSQLEVDLPLPMPLAPKTSMSEIQARHANHEMQPKEAMS